MHRTPVSCPTPGMQQIASQLNAVRPQFRGDTLFDNPQSEGIQSITFLAGNPMLRWRMLFWLVVRGAHGETSGRRKRVEPDPPSSKAGRQMVMLVRWWDGQSHFRSTERDSGERIPSKPLKINKLNRGNLGPESCVHGSDNRYGHPTTIKCSRQENPTDRLWYRHAPPPRRGDLRTLKAAASRAERGPHHDLAG